MAPVCDHLPRMCHYWAASGTCFEFAVCLDGGVAGLAGSSCNSGGQCVRLLATPRARGGTGDQATRVHSGRKWKQGVQIAAVADLVHIQDRKQLGTRIMPSAVAS